VSAVTEREKDRMRDDACVWLLERTSWRDPREFLRDCLHCGRPFWVRAHCPTARYCSPSCRTGAYLRRSGRAWTRPEEAAS
jgi:hypothetical protein